jgi:hypothetical protein
MSKKIETFKGKKVETYKGLQKAQKRESKKENPYQYIVKIHKIRNGGKLLAVGRVIPDEWEYVTVKAKTTPNKVILTITPVTQEVFE